jgi:hypothetical protein
VSFSILSLLGLESGILVDIVIVDGGWSFLMKSPCKAGSQGAVKMKTVSESRVTSGSARKALGNWTTEK